MIVRPKIVACGFLAAILGCAVSSTSAKTNWLLLGNDARAEVYVDSINVERPPSYVKFWSMLNFKQRQRGGWRSEKRLFMYSCKKHSLEWQQSIYFDAPMGEGELIQSRTLNRYAADGLRLGELDPNTKDMRTYKDAVPESAYGAVFGRLC